MKKQILFIHSAGSQGPNEGSHRLVTYLQQALGSEYEVLYPKMPDPENPRYMLWKQKIKMEMADLGDDVILVGHSLGGSVLLKYLSEEGCPKTIAGLFLIAAAFWGVKDWKIDEFVLPDNFSAKLPKIPGVFLYHSREDDWVPVSHLQHYAEKLPDASIYIIEGYQHEFYNGLPELVRDIKQLSNQ